MLAPYSDCPAPVGYRKESVDTLPDIRRLQMVLVNQELRNLQTEARHNEFLTKPIWKKVTNNLRTRMASSDCSAYERDFIDAWLQLRDKEKSEQYAKRYEEYTGYLWALEHDIPKDRAADEESVNLDRINF
jgi:hypothetical protein